MMTGEWRDLLPLLRNVADVGIVALILYAGFRSLRGTRALSMLLGLMMVALVYIGTLFGRLYTLQWVLNKFLDLFPILLVVLFQTEIRRALVQMGSNPLLAMFSSAENRKAFDELVRAVVLLANNRIGAILVIERNSPLNDVIEIGTEIDANVTKELLRSIFHPSSPLHDGAVIIQKGRIAAAGCILPLSMNPNLSRHLGTRHRAALGISEETDAVVLVVSEEQGKISLVVEGRLTRDLDGLTLRKVLQGLFQPHLAGRPTPALPKRETSSP